MPPCNSRLERLLVPEAKSCCSINPVFNPRMAASRAMPAPTMPPPIINTSSGAAVKSARPPARFSLRGWFIGHLQRRRAVARLQQGCAQFGQPGKDQVGPRLALGGLLGGGFAR